jgi:membrane protein DedA with SNARE-associated domain
MLTPEEIQAAREWCLRYGPANCWTGTFVGIAATLTRLLDWYEEDAA